MPVVPPAFIDIFCQVYGDKMRKLFKTDRYKWDELKKGVEASLKIKPDPMNQIIIGAIIRIEFENKILTDKSNAFINALNDLKEG